MTDPHNAPTFRKIDLPGGNVLVEGMSIWDFYFHGLLSSPLMTHIIAPADPIKTAADLADRACIEREKRISNSKIKNNHQT